MREKQSKQEFSHAFDKFDKFLDSQSGDSGIYSCSSSATSSSSKFSSNSNALEPESQSNFIDLMKNPSSYCDFGLSNCFNQLSLKYESLNHFDSTLKNIESKSEITVVNVDSGLEISEDCDKSFQEPWQLYFTQNEDGDTLLHAAIIQGYLEAALSFIDAAPHRCLLNIQNYDEQTALHLAIITNQPKIVRKLVIAGSDLSVRNHSGNTALHLTCISGNLDCAIALMDHILPHALEQRNYNGETSLHIAATKGHLELVKLLVHKGADLEAQELLGGRTPLHLALEQSHLNIVLYLVRECRPNLDAATYAGYTPCQIASCIDKRWISELVRYGATPTDDDFQDDINECSHQTHFSAISRNVTAMQA